jgi:uncharacterized membrane protein
MNIILISIGIIMIAYGIFTYFLRKTKTNKLKKIEAMKNIYGKRAGLIVHFVFYTILPIIAGIVFIFSSIESQ